MTDTQKWAQELVQGIDERYQARKLPRIERSGARVIRIADKTFVLWPHMQN